MYNDIKPMLEGRLLSPGMLTPNEAYNVAVILGYEEKNYAEHPRKIMERIGLSLMESICKNGLVSNNPLNLIGVALYLQKCGFDLADITPKL